MSRLVRADAEHSVSTLELFFDLVFVFAITQVTAYVAADPTGYGALQGLLLLCLVYFSWVAYSWLGTSARIDDRAPTAALLGAMAAMFVLAILMPAWFTGGAWALVATCCYIAVRALHILLFRLLGADSPELRKATMRLAASTGVASALLLTAAVLGGSAAVVLVALAVLIDPIGAFVGGGRGWYLAADHFAERHGLIIIIAIGESLIAVGLAIAGNPPTAGLMVLGLIGVVSASLLYVLYFRRAADGMLTALAARTGAEQARMGRDAFSYGHLMLIAGIIALALALKKSAGVTAAEGLGGHLHGIAGPALAASGVLIVGGMIVIRLRTGLGAPAWLAAGMVLIVAAGVASAILPLAAVLLLTIVGFACAALPQAHSQPEVTGSD